MKSQYTTIFLGILVVCIVSRHTSTPPPAPPLPACDLDQCTSCDLLDPTQCVSCILPNHKITPSGDTCVLCPGEFCTSCD